MPALTKRQHEIYLMIKSYIDERGYAPTFEEIGRHLGVSSMATIHKHLRAMESKGVLRRSRNMSRGIELVREGEDPNRTELPLLGEVAAGAPIEVVEDAVSIGVPSEFIGRRGNFILRVRGDSMIDEQIRDGDLIIVEKRDVADNGQTVVALIDEREATVKKFYTDREQIRLEPANREMKPMYFAHDRVRIQGIVVGLLRKYQL